MKKWIGIMTGTLCILSSSLRGDETFEEPTPQELAPMPSLAVESVEAAAPPEVVADELTPKQVGKASTDSASTAKTSTAAKYVLAASAVALGVAAIILVSRHHGHHAH